MANYGKIFKVSELNPVNIKLNADYDAIKFDVKSLFNMINDDIEINETLSISQCNENKFNFCNKFIGTYYTCYIHHGNAIFSPSDLWIVVCLSYSKYANQDMEHIKNYILSPDTQKQNIIVNINSNKPDWLSVINDTINKLNEKNIIDKDIIDCLENDFSCATIVERLASKIAIMKTVENYTNFYFAGLCGFNYIKLLGTKDDWIKLRHKTGKLKNYGNDVWKEYINNIVEIFDKFIESFDNADVKFFSEMIHNTFDLGLYADRADIVSGWILKLFYGFENQYKICEVPDLFAGLSADVISNCGKTNKINIKTQFIGTHVTTNDSEYNKTNMKYIRIKDSGYYCATYVDDYDSSDENENLDNYSDEESPTTNYKYKLSNESKFTSTIQNIYDFRPIIYCGVIPDDIQYQ